MTPIQETIMAAVNKTPADWSYLVTVIKANHKIPSNGWLRVRGHLQGLINAGLIRRTDSVLTEAYVKVA